jgi:hypothetical protein
MASIARIAIFVMTVSLLPLSALARGAGHSTGHGASHTPGGGSHRISGYTKKNGTHVAPAHATNPNKTKRDNYSSKGNVNPRTGKEGTKDPSK